MAPRTRVIFRADGNDQIGLGHLTRCLALADMIAAEFECVFAIKAPSLPIKAQIQQAGFSILDLPSELFFSDEPVWLHRHASAKDILVVDGYNFGGDYQRALKQRQHPVVYLDDLVAGYQWADLLINQVGGVDSADYVHEPGTAFCLGPSYALLRRPFREVPFLPPPLDANRAFLNMGGADPENHTLRLVKWVCRLLPHYRLDVVTGSAYSHQAALQAAVQDIPQVYLHHNLSAEQMTTLLQQCSIKICPPSGVAYECCAVGGLVLLHPIADNQARLNSYLTSQQLALPLSALASVPVEQLPELAASFAQRQREVFDGQSDQRFQQAFRALALTYALHVRRATLEDMQLYFAWANDGKVRQNATQQQPIPLEQHQGWFSHRVHDPATMLYLFELEQQPVGQVRIEFTGQEGLIDYSVGAEWRGQGIGYAMLRRALLELRRGRPAPWALIAQVKDGNLPSRRVFERLGFRAQPSIELHGSSYHVFRLEFTPLA